jgi:hypothetical protein
MNYVGMNIYLDPSRLGLKYSNIKNLNLLV